MSTHVSTALIVALRVLLSLGQVPARTKRAATIAEVERVRRAAIRIDSHNDITSRTVAGLGIGQPTSLAQIVRPICLGGFQCPC